MSAVRQETSGLGGEPPEATRFTKAQAVVSRVSTSLWRATTGWSRPSCVNKSWVGYLSKKPSRPVALVCGVRSWGSTRRRALPSPPAPGLALSTMSGAPSRRMKVSRAMATPASRSSSPTPHAASTSSWPTTSPPPAPVWRSLLPPSSSNLIRSTPPSTSETSSVTPPLAIPVSCASSTSTSAPAACSICARIRPTRTKHYGRSVAMTTKAAPSAPSAIPSPPMASTLKNAATSGSAIAFAKKARHLSSSSQACPLRSPSALSPHRQ
jgi:hypothetical protein